MRWEELPAVVEDWVVRCAAPAWDVKRAASGVFTDTRAGYYWHPDQEQVAILAPALPAAQQSLLKAAASRAVGCDRVRPALLTLGEASAGPWIKVAYSPALRNLGETLNFFPGTYPGGIPNHPSPLAAMLTSALMGGGLGYGLGWLGGKLAPRGFGHRLKRTGAILGALAGATPGALWALGNLRTNHGLTDSWPFTGETQPADSPLADLPDRFSTHDLNKPSPKTVEVGLLRPKERWVEPPDPARYYQGPPLKLGEAYTRAVASFVKRADFEGFGNFRAPSAPTPYDVNINHLGQTLWDTGASQPLVGAAMGTMYAAQQLPDPNARPGWATGPQLGQLAMNAGKDYATGLALGALINEAVGTPYSAPTFGLGTAALGLVRAGLHGLFQ